MKDEEESFISRFSHTTLGALRDVWLVFLALAVLTTLPYVAAARRAYSVMFTGVLTAYDDTFTYFAWMRQSADGQLFMCDLFTSEPQSCEFFLPLWSFLGVSARLTGLPIPLTFHVARLLAGLLLLIGARAIASSVVKSRKQVRYSLWLYAMSGGLGWLVYALRYGIDEFNAVPGSGSVDLNMPEAIAFRSVFAQVHFSVGAVLIFASIKLLYSALVENKASRALVAGILVSVLAVVHPYLVVVVCAVAAGAVGLWPWLNDRRSADRPGYRSVVRIAVAFGSATFPGIAYLVYLSKSNDVLREWLRITDTLSPPPWEYALGFGIVGVLSVFGFFLLWKERAPYGRLLLIWAVVQAGLLYAPVNFQRRLVEGLQLPLSIAAAVALFWMAGRVFKGSAAALFRSIFLTAVIMFASLTNFGFVIGQIVARSSSSQDSRRYLPGDLVAAFDWLRTNSDRDAVLFSSYVTGNVAPSMTGLHVFLGHYGQTIRSDEKGTQVTGFYTGAVTDEAARHLFTEHRVRYIIYGPFERATYESFRPPVWLRLAYSQGNVEVFEVPQGPPAGPR
jgi:hypothetical protein